MILNKQGLTLIECMIAILLLAIILAGGMAFYFYSNDHLAVATHRRLATEIANTRLEVLKNQDYGALLGFKEINTSISVGYLLGNRTTDVSDEKNDTATSKKYRQIEVDVIWNQPGRADPQEVNLATIISS